MMGFNTYRGEAMSMGENLPSPCLTRPPGQNVRRRSHHQHRGSQHRRHRQHQTFRQLDGGVRQRRRRRKLYRTVEAVSKACQALDLSIPVGKDSLSMKTVWQDGEEKNPWFRR